jgi:hypothetical protein
VKAKTRVKAGGLAANHNETRPAGERAKSGLRPEVLDVADLRSEVIRRLDEYDRDEFNDPLADFSCSGTVLPASWTEASAILDGEAQSCSM